MSRNMNRSDVKNRSDYMHTRRRSREEILAGVLASAINGITKTKMMYDNALSFAQVKHYINYALEHGFISMHEDSNAGKRGRCIYITTEKGLRYLKFYESLNTSKAKASISSKSLEEGDRL
ncbi:MAG: winged helix-turn-helix domain-containing protein [Candidatus Nitrosocaldus sp.]|nr:winged helix-turn-helix domain-containing protein [Candidatus Nitrosocaldus sp.]MDW7999950.1 winged helix-turn-helix domain-containing protein [Candidatus Nitrosocaldus sp.]